MKALSLTQPWASLAASGAKRIETRSWRTSYRGILAIHAAKAFPREARELCRIEPFRWRLLVATMCLEETLDTRPQDVLPRGAVLAVTWLEDVVPVEECARDDEEEAFGDFSAGRWAWKLRDPIDIAEIPYAGSLGLWELDDTLVPEYARRAIQTP